MITLTSCPVCKSVNVTQYPKVGVAPEVFHEIMPQVYVDAVIISHYFVCQSCHVIFQNPRMFDKELDRFYVEGYYLSTININISEEEKDNDEMLRAKIDANIVKERIGEVSSHLDIGASRGYFLDLVGAPLKVGVEPNTRYVTVSGTHVYANIIQVPQQSFSLVTAIHTLEHVADPKRLLFEMVKKVDKSGFIIIEVPTWKSPGGPLRLAHLFHFEPDVLKLLCLQVGLTVIHAHFTPHLLLICQLKNKIYANSSYRI